MMYPSACPPPPIRSPRALAYQQTTCGSEKYSSERVIQLPLTDRQNYTKVISRRTRPIRVCAMAQAIHSIFTLRCLLRSVPTISGDPERRRGRQTFEEVGAAKLV